MESGQKAVGRFDGDEGEIERDADQEGAAVPGGTGRGRGVNGRRGNGACAWPVRRIYCLTASMTSASRLNAAAKRARV